MMIIQIKYADYKLKTLIKEVKITEEIKAKELENKSTYVSPSSLRLGLMAKADKIFSVAPKNDYCPV